MKNPIPPSHSHVGIGLAAAVLALLCAAPRALAYDALFDFDNPSPGVEATPFPLTNNGISATFTGTAHEDSYRIHEAQGFGEFSGNELQSDFNKYPYPEEADTLNIGFDAGLGTLDLDFAEEPVSDPTDPSRNAASILLSAYDGNTLVGSKMATGYSFAGADFLFGHLSYDSMGTAFNRVTLTAVPAYAGGNKSYIQAIDNVGVNRSGPTPAVPEPGSLALIGTGLLPLAGLARRRRV